MAETGGTRRFWADNVVLGLATLLAGLFNTLYSLLLAHALGPRNYGNVAALNNVVGLFLLPLPIVGLAAIRLGKQARQRLVVRATMGLGFVLFLIAALSSAWLGSLLHMPRGLVILYTSSVVFNFGYALYVGFLERARRYGLVGILLVVASGLSVVAVGISVTWGKPHAIFWLGVLQLLVLVGLFFMARHYGEALPSSRPIPLTKSVVATTLGVGTLEALWGLSDSLLAKAHLSAVAAGLYTGMATIGQGLPFVVASLATVMLTATLDDPRRRARYLGRTVIATVLVSGLFVGVLSWIPHTVVDVTLGSQFAPMVALIERYTVAMALLSLITVLTTYGVAIGAYGPMVAAGLGTAFWIFWLSYGRTMVSLVNRTFIAMTVTLVLVLVAFGYRYKKHRSSFREDRC